MPAEFDLIVNVAISHGYRQIYPQELINKFKPAYIRSPTEPIHPIQYVGSVVYNELITGTLRRVLSKFKMNGGIKVKTIKKHGN